MPAKNIKDVLSKLGLSADEVAILLDKEDEVKVDEFSATILGRIEEGVKNDKDFVSSIRNEARGKAIGELETAFKRTFGISPDDAKDKKLTDLFDVAKANLTKAGNATAQQVQDELLQLKAKLAEYDEKVIPGLKNSAIEEISRYKRDEALASLVRKHNLIVDHGVVMPAIMQKVYSRVNVSVKDDGTIEALTKDGLKPVDKATGKKVVTVDELILEELNDMKLVKVNNADPGGHHPKKIVSDPDTNGRQVVGPKGLTKAMANLEAMKEGAKQ